MIAQLDLHRPRFLDDEPRSPCARQNPTHLALDLAPALGPDRAAGGGEIVWDAGELAPSP